MPEIGNLHHLNLSVTDLERSAAWYLDLLGLEKGWEMEDVEGRGRKFVMVHPTLPYRIVLSHHQANTGEAFSELHTGLDHVAFTVPNREELEAWARRLDERDVPHSEIKEGATGWLIVFRDPDNIQLELYTAGK